MEFLPWARPALLTSLFQTTVALPARPAPPMEGKLKGVCGDIRLVFAHDFHFALDDPGRVFSDGFEQSP
jgi:hypothetical protein